MKINNITTTAKAHHRSEYGVSRIKLLVAGAVCAILLLLLKENCSTCTPSFLPPAPLSPYLPDANPSPIENLRSTKLETLTWVEVRDLLAAGTKRVLIPTGGIEQNGPFVSLNKHDLIVEEVSNRAARILGNSLVAPTISFVPEGDISPPTGHMRFPGTLSVRQETFEELLIDTVMSLVAHGFEEIYLFGDSGESQRGMEQASLRVQHTVGNRSKIRFIPEYYNYDAVRELIRNAGIEETRENFHDELAFSLQLLAISPDAIRLTQRLKANVASTGGFQLDTTTARTLGEKILRYRTDELVRAIKVQGELRAGDDS